MPRQKSAVPLRSFNVSLPLADYESLVAESRRWAAKRVKMTVTDIIVDAVKQHIRQVEMQEWT